MFKEPQSRLDRLRNARLTVKLALQGTRADLQRPGVNFPLYTDGHISHYGKNNGRCGLQLLQVLRAILECGGGIEAVSEIKASEQRLTPAMIARWAVMLASEGEGDIGA